MPHLSSITGSEEYSPPLQVVAATSRTFCPTLTEIVNVNLACGGDIQLNIRGQQQKPVVTEMLISYFTSICRWSCDALLITLATPTLESQNNARQGQQKLS